MPLESTQLPLKGCQRSWMSCQRETKHPVVAMHGARQAVILAADTGRAAALDFDEFFKFEFNS